MPGKSEEIILRFQGDAASALKAINQIGKALKDLGQGFGQVQKTTKAGGLISFFRRLTSLGGGILGMLNPIKAVSSAVGNLGGVFQTALGVLAANAISKLAGKLKELATGPVMLAARVEVLENVFLFLGQRAGYAREELGEYLDSLRAVGITTREAAQSLTRMIQSQMDLSKASELARVAQDAAVISGENSSEAFAGIMHGIVSLNTRILRHRGIFVNLQAAYERFADKAGTVAADLSIQTKQQIALNAVLGAGVTISGAYTTAMDFAGKKITSLKRYVEEATVALGRSFLPILGQGIDIVSDFLKKAKGLFEEAQPVLTTFSERVAAGLQSLYQSAGRVWDSLVAGYNMARPYLQELGQILGHYLPQVGSRLKLLWIELKNTFSAFATTISSQLPPLATLWTFFTDTIKGSLDIVLKLLDGFRLALKGQGERAAINFTEAMASGLAILIILWQDYVSEALSWGYRLIAQFAEGMIQAASDLVVGAVEYVGGLIAQFLAAFSPPQAGILQGIIKWGQGLISEYLKGFLLADFGILDQVGSTIKTALQSAVSLGDLPERELIPTFRKVRELAAGLIATFRKTGEISEQALGQISATLGEGGQELVKYIRLQLEHQKALKGLANVEKEYAEAEAKGFVPAELKKRLANAKAQADEAGEQLSWQEALIKAQQEGVDMQVEQLRIMQKLANAIKDVAKAMKGTRAPKAKKRAAAEPEIPIFTVPEIDLGRMKEDIDTQIAGAFSGVSGRFTEAKEQARQLMGEFVEGAKVALASLPGIIRTGIGTAFEVLREKLPWIDTLIAKFDNLKTWWNTSWPTMLATFLTVWTVIATSAGVVVDMLIGYVWPKLQEAFGSLTEALNTLGLDWSDVWNAIKQATGIVAVVIGAIILGLIAAFTGIITAIASIASHVASVLADIASTFKLGIESVSRMIGGGMAVIKGIFTDDLDLIAAGWEAWITGLVGLATAFGQGIVNMFNLSFGTALAALSGFIEGFISFFIALYDRLIGGSIVPDLVNDTLGWFQTLYDGTLGKIGELVTGVVSKLGEIGGKVAGALGKVGEALGLGGKGADLAGVEAGVARLQELIATVSEQWKGLLLQLVGEGGTIPQIKIGGIKQFTQLGLEVIRLTTDLQTRVIQLIVTLKNRAIQVLIELVKRAIQLFTEMKSKVISLVIEMVKEVVGQLEELRDKSEEILEETAQIFEKMAERIKEAIVGIKRQITELLRELDKLIAKAEEAMEKLEEAGLLGGSPSRFEMSLNAINLALKRVQATMGGFPMTMQYQIAATSAAAPGARAVTGGDTYQFYEGAFSGAFPGVRDGRDARDFVTELDDLLNQASAKAQIPGGMS